MSDIVVGIIVGVTGIVGVTVGGIVANIGSRTQLKHQEKEARIARLIKVREGYLIPLREALSKYMRESITGASAYGVVREMQEKGIERAAQHKVHETMMTSIETTAQLIKEIDNLSGQISDAKLSKMILDLRNKEGERELIVRRYSKWMANIADIEGGEWNALLNEYNSVISSQRSQLVPINKRIEELLSGDADT